MNKFILFCLLAWTCVLWVYHLGTLAPPHVSSATGAEARWIDKSRLGIHQLILQGDAYGRGLKAGELTKDLLRLQEEALTTRLFDLVPEPAVMALEIPLILYFKGIEKLLDPWMLEEMFGVSRSAPQEFDRLIDPYTRQLAYHGLHEVGQMMVDQGGDDMGCTVVAVPTGSSWILGRNFDFEGGRVLDREKIVKWVFPDNGFAYVSVIWAGMVGAVTGVNEHGLYISLNAAGSSDFRRFGMPTTLLLAKALMSARTADEALSILKSEPTFITDIFTLLDSKNGLLYRVEKSPLAIEVIRLEGPSVITNHLIGERFKNDPTNRFRMQQLTSVARSQRGEALLKGLVSSPSSSPEELELSILKIIRDKGGGEFPLGNRRAIDALIATHSVIFNSADQTLFVSQGPALAGPFIGFNLKASFEARAPVVVRTLPRDEAVSDKLFDEIHESIQIATQAKRLLRKNECPEAERALARVQFRDSTTYHEALGDIAAKCHNDRTAALAEWKRAMDLHPAYYREEEGLKSKIKEASR